MTKRYRPIICLDFDGVIHSYGSGWKGVSCIPDPPVPGAIDAILRYLDADFGVAIYSSRSKSFRGRWAMKRYLGRAIADHWTNDAGNRFVSYQECECWGDAYSIVNCLYWPWFKPATFITIDDRAMRFDGDWRNPQYSPENIKLFKPWNAK